MKKYIVPTFETIEIKLSECIATVCDGCCPSTGYFYDEELGKDVWMTALTTSGV